MPVREKITIDGPTTQRPYARVHNSTGHTLIVHNRAYIKKYRVKYNYKLTDDEYPMSQVDNSLKLKPMQPSKLCFEHLACLLVSLEECLT